MILEVVKFVKKASEMNSSLLLIKERINPREKETERIVEFNHGFFDAKLWSENQKYEHKNDEKNVKNAEKKRSKTVDPDK